MPLDDLTRRPMFRHLFMLTFAVAVSQQGWTSLYTNFAVEVVGVTGEQTGVVHALREVPGLLSIGVILCLLFMREHTLIALSVLLSGLGVTATGFFPSFSGVLITAVLMSFGFHYYESTAQSLCIQHFNRLETPLVLGRLRSATAAGSLFIGILVFALSAFLSMRWLFCVAGGIAVIGGVWGLLQKPETAGLPAQRRSMVVRRRYLLFYLMILLSGARRHIFTTFSVFLLVSRFHFSVQEMLGFFIVNNAVNWFLNPLIGKAVNSFGERKLLTGKYLVLSMIFLAYSLTDSRLLVAVLYIAEQLFTNFTMAIRTYFQKIADPRDVAPSMAVGQTINHVSAVILPVVGGMLWMVDYRIPFWIGVGVALAALVAAQFIRCDRRTASPPSDGNRAAHAR
jgi:predicted MFS family arabinose efflux permease